MNSLEVFLQQYSSNIYKYLKEILLVNVDKYSKKVVSILLRYYQPPNADKRVFINILTNLPQHTIRKT